MPPRVVAGTQPNRHRHVDPRFCQEKRVRAEDTEICFAPAGSETRHRSIQEGKRTKPTALQAGTDSPHGCWAICFVLRDHCRPRSAVKTARPNRMTLPIWHVLIGMGGPLPPKSSRM